MNMKIQQRQWYTVDPEQLEEVMTRLNGEQLTRPMKSEMVEIFDGDGEPFCYVRVDMAEELCKILNDLKED